MTSDDARRIRRLDGLEACHQLAAIAGLLLSGRGGRLLVRSGAF
jgi:hypothetical protein